MTLAKDFGNGVSASAAVVATDADAPALRRARSGKSLGKTGLVLGVKYSF